MKLIKTIDAVGHILCHDITQIIKDVHKKPVFRKGHIVEEKDIPVLLSMGKDHLYIWEQKEGMVHEDEGAAVLRDLCLGGGMTFTEPKEGKIDILAAHDGLFKVDEDRLDRINEMEELMIAVRSGNTPVKKGDKLAGVRVIPLIIEEKKLAAAKEAAGNAPLLTLLPYRSLKAGIVTTGNEVFHKRIPDTFGPVVEAKLLEYGVEVMGQKIVGDDPQAIVGAIHDFLAMGAGMIVCTGGMSVDPDDRTPGAIRASGAQIVSYGAPVLPGAMFLLSYHQNGVPVLGLPGCVMYGKRTIFDLVLPRLVAGEKLTRRDLVRMGRSGLCLGCEPCHYPNCGFGR